MLDMRTQETANVPPEPADIVTATEILSVKIQLAPEDDSEEIIAEVHRRAETTGSLLEEILHRQENVHLPD
jgi:hypothetical protein